MRSFAMVCLTFSFTTAVRADRMPDYQPLMRVAVSEVAVIGTVTEIDNDFVEATALPDTKEKTKYTLATVKIETNLRGAKSMTHIKVGFFPGSSGTGGHNKFPVLRDGETAALFLVKHHEANFYVFAILAPPIESTELNKETVAKLKANAPVLADPAKALTADKAEDRLLGAGLLVMQYRATRFGEAMTTAKVGLEESQAILKAIAGGDWAKTESEVNAYQLFTTLGLYAQPKFKRVEPKPGDDTRALWKAEFARWLAEDGREYQIDKFVPKAK